jgi:hypothetical protein
MLQVPVFAGAGHSGAAIAMEDAAAPAFYLRRRNCAIVEGLGLDK